MRAALLNLTAPSRAGQESRKDVQGAADVAGSRSMESMTRYAVRSALVRCMAAASEASVSEMKKSDSIESAESVTIVASFAVRKALLRAADAVRMEAASPRLSHSNVLVSKAFSAKQFLRAAFERAAEAAIALPRSCDKPLLVDEGKAGLAPVFDDSTDGLKRVEVKTVIEGSLAHSAGVRSGDEIFSVNRLEVAALSQESFDAEMQVRPLTLVLRDPRAQNLKAKPLTMPVALATKHAVRAALARAALAAGPGDESHKTAVVVEQLQHSISRALVADGGADRAWESDAIEMFMSSFLEAVGFPRASTEAAKSNEDGASKLPDSSHRGSIPGVKTRMSVSSVGSNLTEIEAANLWSARRASQDLGEDDPDMIFQSFVGSFHDKPSFSSFAG